MKKVSIVGAGAGEAHLAGYLELPELFQVQTICDLDTGRAQSAIDRQAKPTDNIKVSTAMADILQDPDIDVVSICLPPHLHRLSVQNALRAGKHVVCEKPMVASLKDADVLIASAISAGRILSPVFQYRFGPAMAQLQALKMAGLVGRPNVAAVETHWNRGDDYYAVPWRGTWAGENGGAVLGHAIHNHDLLTCLFGPILYLSAFVATRVNDIEVEDCAAVSFKMANGALATSSITLGASGNSTRFKLVYEKLTAESGTEPYAPMNGDWTFAARDPADQALVDDVLANAGTVRSGFAGFFENFAAAIDGKSNRAVTAADGRQSLELVTAIYDSARNGKTVALPLGPEHPLYGGWSPLDVDAD